MASVGLALQGYFAEIVVAGGKTGRYAHGEPWGSSPDLDPLWSTERLTFVHDGCEASRLDKIRLITRFPIVLETLRVCWENPSNEYNCCKCEKCLRTMLGLHIAGVLPECKTFALPIDPGLLRELPRLPGNVKAEYQRMIDALGPSAFEVAVKSSLVESLAKQ